MDMLEVLTGAGLAAAAGLNAYIPLLLLGVAARLDWIQLPEAWLWIENVWVLVIFGVLFLIELVADKVPAVDTINDWLQTVVRPSSGGIVFASGVGTETVAVKDPSAFLSTGAWVPIAIGVGLALLVSLAKSLIRPLANTVSGGLAAPVLSTAEDATSIVLVILALIAPVLVILALIALLWACIALFRRMRRRRGERAAATASFATPPG